MNRTTAHCLLLLAVAAMLANLFSLRPAAAQESAEEAADSAEALSEILMAYG